jgi:hypothetical protein
MLPFCLAGFYVAAQSTPKELPQIGLGFGVTTFQGDVGSTNKTGGAFRSGIRFGVQQRFGNWFGAEVFGNIGKLSKSERSLTLNRNFETPYMFFGANAVLYFDNGTIMKREAIFAPFISVGFGWMSFDPHGDLKDRHDSTYNYWSDGSIHTRPENDPLAATSTSIHRDYTYETQLKDTLHNYSRSTFGVPVSLGFQWKFGPHAGAKIQATYHVTFTDYLDNVKDGKNDSWMWYGVSVYYKFGNGEKETDSGPDMNAMMNEDFDKDGIADKDDNCQGTPAGVKVDHHGCPLDGDEDGVADYLDKEPNTKKGAKVDENGVELDYTKIAVQAEQDSVNAIQKEKFENNPGTETLKQANPNIQPKTGADCIPENFRAADANKDCVITADEINTVIDNFFDGIGNWTADGINQLIDYFFDQ